MEALSLANAPEEHFFTPSKRVQPQDEEEEEDEIEEPQDAAVRFD